MSPNDEPSDDSDDGGIPDWDPKRERELDPGKLQAEYLKVMKEFMAELRAAKAQREKEAAAPIMPPTELGIGARVSVPAMPKPPTFDEQKAKYKKAWEATKEIAPDAHYAVQCEIFRLLAHHIEYNPDDSAMTAEASM